MTARHYGRNHLRLLPGIPTNNVVPLHAPETPEAVPGVVADLDHVALDSIADFMASRSAYAAVRAAEREEQGKQDIGSMLGYERLPTPPDDVA